MYLKKPLPYRVRQRLRCGTAPLKLGTGRFENMNVEQQICQICNTDVIEDEMHFLMSCNAH